MDAAAFPALLMGMVRTDCFFQMRAVSVAMIAQSGDGTNGRTRLVLQALSVPAPSKENRTSFVLVLLEGVTYCRHLAG